ncbi:pre-mRNA branch site protein p14 [Penicillium atrosanguineum]|uniref:Pre-mRNA branch site protein p14 n=1 Tax=Penicillium atrosanguineum TaxID=1132637 RepID=A0A9W9U5I6_9EURO|nr:pre-mRNA branch site protein p14 [Penicillium atrosanguineum]
MSRKLAPEANRYVRNYCPPPASVSNTCSAAEEASYVFNLRSLQYMDVNPHFFDRILFVKNLNYNVTAEQLFDLFGKFGPIRQIRQGIANNSKGTAFVVYEDVHDAKQACDKLNGFNFQNRYLVVLYHQPEKMLRSKEDLAERQENLERLKQQHGIE